MKILPVIGLLATILAQPLPAEEVTKPVELSELSSALQKNIQTQVGEGKVLKIERDDDDGDIVYEVEMNTKNGEKRIFSMDQEGRLLSIEIALKEAPEAVQKTIITQIGEGKLELLEKSFEENQVSYDALMTTKAGQLREFTIDPDGTLSSLEIGLDETPASVQKTVAAQVANGKVECITKVFEGQTITYEVEFSVSDQKPRSFSVGSEGKLESLEITLSETPTEARKTIQERVGNGKILMIEKIMEGKKKGQRYDVYARKDGKTFNFSVNAKGKFLGVIE